MELDGLVVIGGDDSNTNAAVLAEYFSAKGGLNDSNLFHGPWNRPTAHLANKETLCQQRRTNAAVLAEYFLATSAPALFLLL